MKNREKCTSCGRYFWKGQLAPLPTDADYFVSLSRTYCPRCFPDILEEYSELNDWYWVER